MNIALTQRGMINALTDIERSPREGRSRLDLATRLYDNHYDPLRERALDAFIEGRAAFWTTAKYHSQFALSLCSAANSMSLAEAVTAEFPPHRANIIERSLDSLVPLNFSAAQSLSKAYARLGIWRDAEELEMRRVRRLPHA